MAAGSNAKPPYPSPQLFDMEADPLEQRNVALENPGIVRELQAAYDAWFAGVTAGRDYSDDGVARIYIGDPREDPVRLTRQDWRGPEAGWTPTSIGHWLVDVRSAGRYSVTLRFAALADAGMVTFQLGATKARRELPAGSTTVELTEVALPRGEGTLSAWVTHGARRVGAQDLVLSRR